MVTIDQGVAIRQRGGQRLQYASGPFGKHTWHVDLDAAGRQRFRAHLESCLRGSGIKPTRPARKPLPPDERMDELLREPLGTILHRIPLSERIYDATVLRTGPYAPSLQMACALVVGIVAALVPGWRSSQIRIVDGLRHVG